MKMDCCEAVYELDPVVGKAVLRGENPDIAEADLRLVQEDGTPKPGRRL